MLLPVNQLCRETCQIPGRKEILKPGVRLTGCWHLFTKWFSAFCFSFCWSNKSHINMWQLKLISKMREPKGLSPLLFIESCRIPPILFFQTEFTLAFSSNTKIRFLFISNIIERQCFYVNGLHTLYPYINESLPGSTGSVELQGCQIVLPKVLGIPPS